MSRGIQNTFCVDHNRADPLERARSRIERVEHDLKYQLSSDAHPSFRRSVEEPALLVQDQIPKDRFAVMHEGLFELKGVLRRRVHTDLFNESNACRSLSDGNELPS